MIDVPHLKMANLLLNEKCSKNDASNLYTFMLKANVYAMIKSIKQSSFDELKDNDTLTVKDFIEFMVSNEIALFLPRNEWFEQKGSFQNEYAFIGKYFCKQFLKQNFPGIYSLNLQMYYTNKKWAIDKLAIPFLEYNLAHGGDLKLSPSIEIDIPKNEQEIYYIEDAITKFKNVLLTEYNCSVSNTKNTLLGLSKEDVILSCDQIESSLDRLNGKTDAIDYLLLGIEKIRKIQKEDMWLGDGPFCIPQPEKCEEKFGWGYSAVDPKEINKNDYDGYGSSCQTGYKVLCRYYGKPTKYYKYNS